jgi:hypothetical protein
MVEERREQWYGNKEIYDMLMGLKEEISEVRFEMRETKILIRDYNGLRSIVQDCKERLDLATGQANQSKSIWEKTGYLVGAAGLTFAIWTYIVGKAVG